MSDTQWLEWVRQIQAIAQTGLTYGKCPYDRERYAALQRIGAEMMARGTGISDAERVLGVLKLDEGYCTPKVDVRAAVFDGDGILLVKEREDGRWTLPGGWADVGDSPSAAAVREVKEEAGLDVVAKKLAAVYDRDRHGHPPIPFHAYKLFFLCEITGGEPKTSYETIEAGFFREDAIPPLSLTRVTEAEIAFMFEHRRHPEWPTTFD